MPMNIKTHPKGMAPDFTLYKPKNSSMITNATWFFMEQLLLLEPGTQNGGQYAHKSGYHDTVNHNNSRSGAWQDYSTESQEDRDGNRDVSRGTDWTHPQAQSGNYTTMAKYGDRLEAAFNARDPRLYGFREALGQTDKDATAEGLDFDGWYWRTPDSSHAWHWHFSHHTKYIEDFWAVWAFLTTLAGWTVAEWERSKEDGVDYTTYCKWQDDWVVRVATCPDNGDSKLVGVRNHMRGFAVTYAQGGLPPNMNLLAVHNANYLAGQALMVADPEITDEQIAEISEAARAGAEAGAADADAIAEAVVAKLDQTGLTDSQMADVKVATKEAYVEVVTAGTASVPTA